MKKLILGGMLGVVLCGGVLSSCSDETGPFGGSTGKLVPNVNLDTSVRSAEREGAMKAPASRAESSAMEITAEDLTLKLTPKDGGESFSCVGVSQFPVDKEFRVGEYTFEASYGNPEEEGFEKPAYYGSGLVVVEENKTSSVSVNVELINSMVSLNFGEGLTKYGTDISAHVQTTGEKIAFTTSTTDAAYVQPGTTIVTVTLTKPNGVSGTVTAATFTSKAKTHHHVYLDIKDGANDAILTVEFDDTLDGEEDVEIELSDDILNAPAPVVKANGFTSGEGIDFVPGLSVGEDLSVDITAQAEIKSVLMTTKSASLLAQGWPEEIDLTQATLAEQQTLKSLGLDALGLFKNPGRMAVVDLTGITKYIKFVNGADNETKITLLVTDQAGKTPEDGAVALVLNAEDLVLTLSPVTEVYSDAGEPIEFNLEFNGADPENELVFEYKNARGSWSPLTLSSVAPLSRAVNSYKVSVVAPELDFNVEIRANCKVLGKQSNIITIKNTPFKLNVDENDVFAWKATLTVTGSSLTASELANIAQNGTFEISPDVENKSVDGTSILLEGLSPATTYKATLTYDGDTSRQVTFTTEAATQLPDAGFDDWTAEKKGDYQYLWTVGTSKTWGTLNSLTTSTSGSGSGNGLRTSGCAYKATSGTIPANGRSTKSDDGGGLIGTQTSGDGHTVGDANIHSDKAYAGNNAALIRTVGWGSGTNAASLGRNIDNVTVGQLFIGSYEDGNAIYGSTFNSRPKALSFYYQYMPKGDSSEHGTAEITLYDASGNVIATASADLAAANGYSQVTMPLTYEINSKKASKISVIFKSSSQEYVDANSTWLNFPGYNNVSGGEYIGSELYIDEVTLNY